MMMNDDNYELYLLWLFILNIIWCIEMELNDEKPHYCVASARVDLRQSIYCLVNLSVLMSLS